MKMIHITAIIYLFSVVIPIQSGEIIYNYDNLGEMFAQGSGVNDFHLFKYSDIDTIFDEKYEGSNIGGAYLIEGNFSNIYAEVHVFPGYLVNITATFYCGSTKAEEGGNSLWMGVQYIEADYAQSFLCRDRTGWRYDYTWTPAPTTPGTQGFKLNFRALNATPNRAYGFDELRIATSEEPPQPLQRDNNSANNNPQKNTANNNPQKNTSSNNP